MANRAPVRAPSTRVAELIAIMADAEAELAELTGGQVDAVVDPRSAAPILLRSAQVRLAASEEKLRDVLARCPVLVLELDRTGRICYSNEAVVRAFGGKAENVENRSWCDFIELTDDVACRALLNRIFEHGITNHPTRMTAGGPVHWVEWTSAGAESPERILLFGVDVTQRRDLNAEQVARAEAEAANQAKSDFLAKMSHELRTPLNAISGYAELLDYGIAGPLNEKQMDYLSRIKLSQRHLLSLIDDVISFAKLEAGKLALSYQATPVSELLELLETLTTPTAARRDVSLDVRTFQGGDTVWGDRDKIEQILVNLVTNAIKFTDPGGRIEVRCAPAKDQMHFTVNDTGCGIPAEKLESIFMPFVQVENGLTRSRDGVGLGLAISRELARTMGGDLVVASALGKGSVFRLILPRHQPK